jgi:hypothetical protein
MSLGLHRALELLIGLALVTVPIVLSSTTTEVGGGGVVVCVVLGTVVSAAALGAEDAPRWHASLDRMLPAALLVATLALLLVGENVAAGCCLVVGVAQLALALPTRYVTGAGGR